jgi:hypothetical protein
MSVKKKSIVCNSPRDLLVLASLDTPIWDASPIYETVTVTVTHFGSYSPAGFPDLVIDYDYSGTRTWTRAPVVGDDTNSLKIDNRTINGLDTTFHGSIGDVATIDDDEFLMFLTRGLISTSDTLWDYKKPAARIQFGTDLENEYLEENALIGTLTNNGSTPPVVTDLICSIFVQDLFFELLSGSGERYNVDAMVFSMFGVGGGGIPILEISEDVTEWDNETWRDFRGTYSTSRTDANGVTTTLEISIA